MHGEIVCLYFPINIGNEQRMLYSAHKESICKGIVIIFIVTKITCNGIS